MICARCNQAIAFRELFHEATRAAKLGAGDEAVIVPGATVIVHDYPCPTHIVIVGGRVVANGVDIGPEEQLATTQTRPLMVEVPMLTSPPEAQR